MVSFLVNGCSPNQNETEETDINPQGVFAQLLRIDAQEKSDQFEELLAELTTIADSSSLPHPYYWICYRETPDHYWILTISDSVNNFKYPGTVVGFASTIAEFATPEKRSEILTKSERLKDLPFDLHTTQQFSKWSTTNNVESRDYPFSRVVIFNIKEGKISEYHENVVKLTKSLDQKEITFQVEGFLVVPSTLNAAWQVIFVPDSTSIANVPAELSNFQESIKANTQAIEYFDGKRIDKLSYGTY